MIENTENNRPYPRITPAAYAETQRAKSRLRLAGYVDHTRDHKTNIMVCPHLGMVADVRKVASGTGGVVFQPLCDQARAKLYLNQSARKLTIDEFNEAQIAA